MKKLFSVVALMLSVLVIIANGPAAYAQTVIGTGDTSITNNPDATITLNNPSEISANSNNINIGSPIIIYPPDPSAYARLFVNDSKIAFVEYGGSATLRWESNKMSSCTIAPTGQTGTNGQYTLQNITNNMQIGISCLNSSGARYVNRGPNVTVDVKVLPPTYDYVRNYLLLLQSGSTKKVNFTSTSTMIDLSQKAFNSGKTDVAQAFLQKSIGSFKQQATRAGFAADSTNQYEHAASYLSKTLPISLTVATDGCSVTATGPAGISLDYGSHELGLLGTIIVSIGIDPQYPIIHGYLAATTIPESGTITESIPSRSGWTAFGMVVDSDGLIYALKTVDVTTDCATLSPTHLITAIPSF